MIYQVNTQNLSFLKMSYILKEMGVKNHSFFLILYDEALANIDPRSEDLTIEQQIRVHLEAKRNIWYYFRELLRIPGAANGERFELHRANLALLFNLVHNINTIILTPRQCYKTTSIMAFYHWGLKFGFKNTSVGMFTLSENLSKNNMERLKQIKEFLPNFLKTRHKKDVENAGTIKLFSEGNINQIITKAVGTSEESASNSARGFSFPCLFYDEYAFITWIKYHYNTAVYSYSTAAAAAETNGLHHHILFSTTAGNLYEECGRWAYERLETAAPFFEGLYDFTYTDNHGIQQFDKERIYRYIINQSKNSRNIFTAFVRVEYEYFELNKPDDYLETQRALSTDEISFEREVLLKWLKGSGDHPLGKDRVELLQNQIRKPNHIKVIDNFYTLNIYRDYIDPDIPYILAADCSGNMNKDFSTFVAIDPTNYEVVATMRINQYSIMRFANVLVYLMRAVFQKGFIIIERNGVGLGVVDMVKQKIPLNRIWKDEKEIYGINSSKELRETLYRDVLRTVAIHYYNKIHDRNIINEIADLKYDKRGRIDHDIGKHDDTLMAYLWGMWFLFHYKHKTRYIDPIYIGMNLNESEERVAHSEVEEMINMREKNIFNKFNRWTKTQQELNNPFLDGTKTPEELIQEQRQTIIEKEEEMARQKATKGSRMEYAKYLNAIKEKEAKKEVESMTILDKKDENDLKTFETLSENDIDTIEKTVTEEEKRLARERIMKMINLKRTPMNNDFFGRRLF